MQKEREIFINGLVNEQGEVEVDGCLRRGVDRKTATSIFNEIESFASYAFNKSHAAAYATIAYQTAWLKCQYPKEYMASLLSSVLDNQNKLVSYIAECQRMGIFVLPPSINESYSDFTVVGDNIRFGLSAIKNLSVNLINTIVQQRDNGGRFNSFYDFCKRNYGRGLNSKSLESLIKCGALDNLDCNRRQMLSVMKSVLDSLEYDKHNNLSGQMSLFDIQPGFDNNEIQIPNLSDFSVEERLRMEKEISGIYFSGHPISKYRNYIAKIKSDLIGNILNSGFSEKYRDGATVRVVCIISKQKKQLTKSNQMMSFLIVEDEYGSTEVLVFPKTLDKYTHLIKEGNIVEIIGTVNCKEDEEPKIICESVKTLNDSDIVKNTDIIGDKANYSKSFARNNNDVANSISNNISNNVSYNNSNNGLNSVQNNRLQHDFKNTSLDSFQKEKQMLSNPNVKLYLRIDSLEGKSFKKCKRLLEIFDGKTPVVFFLTDSNKQFISPKSMWVDLNEVLIRELRFQIGEENVKIK